MLKGHQLSTTELHYRTCAVDFPFPFMFVKPKLLAPFVVILAICSFCAINTWDLLGNTLQASRTSISGNLMYLRPENTSSLFPRFFWRNNQKPLVRLPFVGKIWKRNIDLETNRMRKWTSWMIKFVDWMRFLVSFKAGKMQFIHPWI